MNQPKTLDEGSLRVLGMLRIGASALLLASIIQMGSLLWSFTALPSGFWAPVSLMRLVEHMPSRGYADLVWWMAATSTILMGAGVLTRWTTPVAAVSASVLGMLVLSFGKIYHDSQALVLLFGIMALSDWGNRLSFDAWWRRRRGQPLGSAPSRWPNWHLQVYVGLLGLLYFSSGFLKVYHGQFLAPGHMQQFLATRQQLDASWKHEQWAWVAELTQWLISHPWAAQAAAWVAVVFELGMIGAFLSRRIGIVALGAALMFHGMIGTLTDLTFYAQVYLLIMLGTGLLLLRLRDHRPRTRNEDSPLNRPRPPLGRRWAPWPSWAAVTALLLAPSITTHWASLGTEPVVLGLRSFPEALQWGGLFPVAFALGSLTAAAMVAWMARDAWRTIRQPSPREAEAPEHTLLYDRDCGFCQRWVNWASRRGASQQVAFEPCQYGTTRRMAGLSPSECAQAAYLVARQGDSVQTRRAAAAINGVLEHLPGKRNAGYRAASLLYRLQGIHQLQNAAYQWVARRRHRWSTSCSTHGKPGQQ